MTQISLSYVLPDEIRDGTLLYLLSNHLILCHTVPYLSVSAVLNLAATCRAFRALVYGMPQVFRHLDLTQVKTAQFEIAAIDHGGETWRNVQLDENLTEDDFYSGPLRGIFTNLSRLQVLRQVHTLILDGLAVTAEFVHELLTDASYNIRILSLRDVKHLNEGFLRKALQTACRPTRPNGMRKLKALYIFSPRERLTVTTGNVAALGAGAVGTSWNARSQAAISSLVLGDNAGEGKDAWYVRRGKMLTRAFAPEWANTLLDCRDVIAFDAVLCKGPRHINSPVFGKLSSMAPRGSQFAVATHAVGGCEGCGAAPEGWTVWGDYAADGEDGGEIGRFPLLAPPPLFSSNFRVAMCPSGQNVNPSRYGPRETSGQGKGSPQFIARCMECLRDRYCWSCHRWWCEVCFPGPVARSNPTLDVDLKVRLDGNCGDCWLKDSEHGLGL